VAVVGRDDNQRLLQDAELLELLNGGAHRVVQLEQVAQRAVVVERVHLLVDGRRLRHEEEALLAAALVQHLDGLDRHLLLPGQVLRRAVAARRVVLELLEVLREDVPVEPDGQVAAAEDAQRLLVLGSRQQRRLVQADTVALVGEFLVVVLAFERARAGDKLLGATTEVDVGAVGLGPGVVADAVECLVDQRPVVRPETGMGRQCGRGRVGNEGSRDGAPSGALNTISKERERERAQPVSPTQVRNSISTMVSTLGSSSGSGDESA
jgi:hypothetical protein